MTSAAKEIILQLLEGTQISQKRRTKSVLPNKISLLVTLVATEKPEEPHLNYYRHLDVNHNGPKYSHPNLNA